MSLAAKISTGVLWNLAEQFVARGISVVVTLVLAYFLSPDDFGLIAMMSIFLQLASLLMELGFKDALIRMEHADQKAFNTAFYANVLLSFFAYSILYVSAPYISVFYEEPQLVLLIRLTGLMVIINSFQLIQIVILSRKLDFKAQFRAAFPASVISAIVTLYIAYAGAGVWALVAQMLISAFLISLLLWMQGLWRPTLSVSWSSLSYLYRFGYKLFLSGLVAIVFSNLYVAVIAKIFSATVAGLYFFADRIKEIAIFQIVTAIQKVTYPALATLQNDDTVLKGSYRKVITMSTFLIFPIILFLAAFAEQLFHIFLAEKWWPAINFLQLICFANLLLPLHSINLNILIVKGRSDLFLRLELIKLMLTALILALTFQYGVTVILIGQIVGSIVAYIVNSFYARSLIDYSITEQIKDFLPHLLLTFAIAISTMIVGTLLEWPDILEVLIFGLIDIALYVLGARLFKLEVYYLTKELIFNRLTRQVA